MKNLLELLDKRCAIIGEVAQSHDGSLGLAHAFIDAIAEAGADAVKFQTHLAHAESTPAEPWRVQFSTQDKTRYEYWKRMEFSEEHWISLKRHANEKGLLFLSSPFSIEAVELLERVGVAAWKVASGEVTNAALLRRLTRARIPVILSSGMSTLSELDTAIKILKTANVPCAILQCTSEYPCPPERVGMNLIADFRSRYNCFVGISDHSGTIFPALAAVTLGASVVEVHVTLSRQMFGPDVPSSITVSELRQLVEGVRFIEKMMQNPVDKDELAMQNEPMRRLFTKSVVSRIPLSAGTVLQSEHVTAKKPGTGIPAVRIHDVIGRRLRNDVEADQVLLETDLE